jgi:hypothetical protein
MAGQMLGDPEFYTMCPYFLHMRELGISCYTKYLAGMSGKCTDCSGEKLFKPAILAFISHGKLLLNEQPTVLESVKDYLGKKRGIRPAGVAMTYRIDGEIFTLRF